MTLKRIAAYLIDIILVSILATIISSNSYINKDYKKYQEVYDEYVKKHNEYDKYYTKLENYYENNKISEKEYKKLLKFDNEISKKLVEYYEDKKITNKEYDKVIVDLNTKHSKAELDYNYKLLKLSIIPTIINLMCVLLYFVVIQFYFDGQTLGKKIMKLKVVSNNEKKLSILNYLFRSLVVNNALINFISIICLIVLSKSGYISYNKVIYVINYTLEMTILFMILFDKNSRGLHDYISNTKVIEDKRE